MECQRGWDKYQGEGDKPQVQDLHASADTQKPREGWRRRSISNHRSHGHAIARKIAKALEPAGLEWV